MGREEELAARALDEALRAGAVEAEVFVKRGVSHELHAHQRRLETVSSASETGIGVRFFLDGGRMGYLYTAETDLVRLRRSLTEAIAGTEDTDGNEAEGLPDPPDPAAPPIPAGDELGAYDPRSATTNMRDRVDFLRRTEESALETDTRVAWVDALFLLDGRTRVWLRNSKGFSGTYRQSLTTAVLSVLARDEDLSIGSYHGRTAHALAGLDPESLGAAAARRSLAPLGGRRLTPQRVTAVFEPPVAASLLRYVAPSFLADARQRGRSLYPEAPGELVASEALTIVDDGRLAAGLSTAPFDGEGVPTRRTVLLEKGILRGVLYDARTARADGKSSTGNSVRRSFRDLPVLGVTNFYIEPGKTPVAELLRGLPSALRVVNLMNVGGINPVTGELSFACSGVWMEKGREAHPVSGVTLSGSLREMLRLVVAVGDDVEFQHEDGAFGSPTLVVEGLTVAG